MKYFMVGIKGSRMSALTRLLTLDGHIVEGVDVGDDFYTSKSLENIKIYSFDEFILKDDFFYIIGNAYYEVKMFGDQMTYMIDWNFRQ